MYLLRHYLSLKKRNKFADDLLRSITGTAKFFKFLVLFDLE